MNKSELKSNMGIGFFLIGIMLVIVAGFYSFLGMRDFNNECFQRLTQDYMDNGLKCGDFGEYYFKFLTLTGINVIGIAILIKSKDFLRETLKDE